MGQTEGGGRQLLLLRDAAAAVGKTVQDAKVTEKAKNKSKDFFLKANSSLNRADGGVGGERVQIKSRSFFPIEGCAGI